MAHALRETMRLPIHTLRVATNRGPLEVRRTVPCPSHDPVSLEQCRTCERLDGITRDASGLETGVACHPPVRDRNAGERTLWSRLSGHDAPPDPARTPIAAIMTCDVTCVSADFSLEAVAALFLDKHIGAVPVVDYEGCPIGMLTKTDLVRDDFGGDSALAEPDTFELTVRVRARVIDLMSPIVHTLRQRDSVSTAAALMLKERLHHLPVVDDNGRVAGMLSTFDFARWIVYARPA